MRPGSGSSGKINVQGYLDVKQVAGVAASLNALGYMDKAVNWSSFLNETMEFVERLCRDNGAWRGAEADIAGSLEYLESMGFSMAQLRDRKRNSSLANAFKREVEDEMKESMTLTANLKVSKPINKEIEAAAREVLDRMYNAPKVEKVGLTEEQMESFGYNLLREKPEATKEYDVVSQSDEGERIVRSALPPGFDPKDIMTKGDNDND